MPHPKDCPRRKRRREQSADESDESQPNRPRKKRQKRCSDNYPPHVWDNLSKINLTRKALREFDRRIPENGRPQAATAESTAPRLLRADTRRLELLARNGGPDLSRLRGYAELPTTGPVMTESTSNTSKRKRSSGVASSMTKTGTTGPYNPNFEQLLIDNCVYPVGYQDSNGVTRKPRNMDAIRERLARSRRSLSPSQFDEAAFEQFESINRKAKSEQDVTRTVMPTIQGNASTNFHYASNILFNNLAKLADGIGDAKPDSYDGASPSDIEPSVRTALKGYIVPSTDGSHPAAPNNFTEIKGPSGNPRHLRRQAMYAGFVGARSVFKLQNYGNEVPVYDGNAYALVSTYQAEGGFLIVYATHPMQSATGQTQYYTTQLRSYSILDTPESFRQGAAALRNSRDFSKEQRDSFIASANATARAHLHEVPTPSSSSVNVNATSSRTQGTSSESDTLTDELAREDQEPPKRQRTES